MGQKWFESLHLVKAKSPEDEAKKPKQQRKGRKKWKFWKSSVHASDDKQELVSRRKENYGTEEWAAVVIQTAFRVFLARRAFRAMKGLVRLQALVRGRKVRKQACITLRCMQTLVKVQAGVRARQAKMLSEVSAAHIKAEQQAAILRNIDLKGGNEKAWLDSVWTKEEIVNRIHEKQKAAVKRERALAYAFSHQWRAHTRPASEHSELEWGWLERWMAARPWENHAVEEALKNGNVVKSNKSEIKGEMPDSPKKVATPAKADAFESPKKKNGTLEPPKKSFESPHKKNGTLETPPKKFVDSPKTPPPKYKNGTLESPRKGGKNANHKESESFDSPRSVQSSNSRFQVSSPTVTPTKVVNGVVKPVVKSRYMNPRKVPRAESNPKERPSFDELEQQKKRLSLPTPRAKELSTTPTKA